MAISDLSPIKGPKGPTCAVCIELAGLPESEAAALRGHLANPQWRYTGLSEALQTQGVKLPAYSLARHARGQCGAGERLR